jgi:hypothetical protein
MNFFIRQNSTLPDLKYPITQKLMEKYGITENMLENVAVTFSMIDIETGIYKIANVAANIVFSPDRALNPTEEYYTLVYRFNLSETKKIGRYLAEFVIDFLGDGNCGKIKLPVSEEIIVNISSSITKTSVI